MLQTIFSLIFFLAFMFYVVIGVYSVTRNINKKLNLLFVLICLSISVWTYGFAISNSLHSYEEVLVWRRFSALGWSFTFSFILRFVLELTETKLPIKRRWVIFLIYLPATINVLVFSLYDKIARYQYNLIQTEAGWGNIPLNNFWDIFYIVYYITFSMLVLVLLVNWYKRSDLRKVKQQARGLIISFVASVILGSFSEMLLNSFIKVKIPSIAPLFISLPIVFITYSIVNYGLMNTPITNQRVDEFAILNNEEQLTYFKTMTGLYFLGAIVNLLQVLIYNIDLSKVLLTSSILVAIGTLIFIIPYLRLKGRWENLILALLIATTIPLIQIVIISESANELFWPLPVFFMMMTIVINNRKMLAIVSGVSLLTAIGFFYKSSQVLVSVNGMDYIGRLIIYGICIAFAFYINKIYVARLKENDQHVAFQQMISTISTNLINVTSDNFDEKIKEVLEICCDFALADRGYIGLCNADHQGITIASMWQQKGENRPLKDVLGKDIASSSWIRTQLRDNNIVNVANSDLLNEDYLPEKAIMHRHKIKSLIFIPININEQTAGFIGMDAPRLRMKWLESDDVLVRVLANIVGDAMVKVEAETELNFLAYYDSLTHLPNKSYFVNRLEQGIIKAEKSHNEIGLILIDLDGFKDVNDTLGHESGDRLLKQVAERLESCMNVEDLLGRVGGDEFLIMAPQSSGENRLVTIAQKIMAIFQEPVHVNDHEFFVTASAGLSSYPYDGEDGHTLIKSADLAMYVAKDKGKNQYVTYSESMKVEIEDKLRMMTSLHKALDEHEFSLIYQPLIRVADHTTIGREAFIRWQHPERGLVEASDFMALAEESGLIHGIGEWAIMVACKDNKARQEINHEYVPVAVNVSVLQLKNGHLREVIKKCLRKTGLEAKYLTIEISEDIAMKEWAYLISELHEIKALGVSITIDAFGSEYSSLSRLKELPVDALKIDHTFIEGIRFNDKDDSIVSVIIHLAKSLGLNVIADGVAEQSQYDFLCDVGCDVIQGPLYTVPISEGTVEIDPV